MSRPTLESTSSLSVRLRALCNQLAQVQSQCREMRAAMDTRAHHLLGAEERQAMRYYKSRAAALGQIEVHIRKFLAEMPEWIKGPPKSEP